MRKYFGVHVSAAGGLESALKNGRELGVNTIQIHPSPPQRWNSKPFAKGVEDAFLKEQPNSGVKKIFFHGVYLINLAGIDPQKVHLAKLSLVHDLDLISRIKGDGVVFHVGSNNNQPDEESGFAQVAKSINWILENSPNNGRLILEVAAGSGKVIGDRMEELARIYEEVDNKERVGFGLDTQHMWASGYDWRNNLEEIIADIKKIFGLEKVWLIHLNDSMTELGSKKDRHDNLGEGLIGMETIKKIFLHPALKDIPIVLETPNLKSMETAAIEVEKMKGFLG